MNMQREAKLASSTWGRKSAELLLGRIYTSGDKHYFALLSVVYKLQSCKEFKHNERLESDNQKGVT